MQLLLNHLGYECQSSKKALIVTRASCPVTAVQVVDCQTGHTVMELPVSDSSTVDNWQIGDVYSVDFSSLTDPGTYQLRAGDITSDRFEIKPNLLIKKTFSDLLHYFKSQRCSGEFDDADTRAPLLNTSDTVDVSGGWYDASGDVSKYLSHLSYANYMNPQQTPMVVWNMLTALELAENSLEPFVKSRLLDEALYGADFLVRMQDSSGFFYLTVFDKWSKDTAQREICAYETQEGHKTDAFEAGFRQGAGVSIAALAVAARQNTQGEYPSQQYLITAERGYWHLVENNRAYLDDGQENLIDAYCALLAAVELFRTTKSDEYLTEARRWTEQLAHYQQSDEHVQHFWSATHDGSRPYFHAAEAGLPAIALMQYLAVEHDGALTEKYQQVLEQALRFELSITSEVSNPFGYPRQYVKPVSGEKRSSFFVAQDNETGYWWQGENARLGSLASMAFMAGSTHLDPALKRQLKKYGQDALDWVLGLNPYDMCMLDGYGRNNPDYLPELGFFNAYGGICNGITAGFKDPSGIAFNPEPQKDDMLQNWRWGEQWIPHAAWFLLAIAAQSRRLESE
ncbi:glycoside hydrolase family 9 protein [Veronia pacifica]|uniref:Chitobiase n=1 Tax=Veronia pacifica TaxID=1080227 RepID=A0A1C3EGQ0_9GAMM|nr:glycoside hydrolase family 9 protein [Veronia pacifica]ODA32432.1 chitobiase [Veronia pacifica]